jgi:hypothetical protein
MFGLKDINCLFHRLADYSLFDFRQGQIFFSFATAFKPALELKNKENVTFTYVTVCQKY